MKLTRRQMLAGSFMAMTDIVAHPVKSIAGAQHTNKMKQKPDDGLPDGLVAVEWLESTGTQWINAGQIVGATTIKAKLAPTALPSSGCYKAFGINWYTNFGDDCGVDSTRWCSSDLAPCTVGKFVEVEYNALNRLVDGKVIGGNGIAFLNSANNGKSLFLFCGTNGTRAYITSAGNYQAWRGRISRFTVFSNDTIIRDLVSVRSDDDGLGYMYDKATGETLGNGGTGEFLIGPDL